MTSDLTFTRTYIFVSCDDSALTDKSSFRYGKRKGELSNNTHEDTVV